MNRVSSGKRLLGAAIFFILLIVVAAAWFSFRRQDAENAKHETAMSVVALNEIKQLAEQGKTEEAAASADRLAVRILDSEAKASAVPLVIGSSAVCIAFIVVAFLYVYLSVLRPFAKMERFADAIARGDFSQPLKYERSDYFGRFTWAFDSMRREITKARACEREAIENNKTVIATLSHDIKTPISSIRAYAEGLAANLDRDAERRAKYIDTIMKKCDEVASLTNDLFTHSISDLDKLRLSPQRTEICSLTAELVGEIAAERGDVSFEKAPFEVAVSLDVNRYTQILENIINNARKYAKSQVEVYFTQGASYAEEGIASADDGLRADKTVSLHVRDYGKGIADEDMPFIFDKFYRGKNCGTEAGSGLGLYIVKYLMEQHGGSIAVKNHIGGEGTEFILTFPAVS